MIWLLGASGYIGSAFARELTARKIFWAPLPRMTFDELLAALRTHRPSLVINAAGYIGRPNVDACEDHKAETLLGNLVLPIHVAHACAAAGVSWGYVSTGCVYQGDGPWSELNEPNFDFRHEPASFYSGTKALAEEVVRTVGRGYIWRLRIPFDEEAGPRNYITKLLTYPRLLDARNSLAHRGDFVRACLDLWEKRADFGIYNVVNPGSVTTREVCELILQHTKLRPLEGPDYLCYRAWRPFAFFTSLEDFSATVKAPRSNCVLDAGKLLAAGISMRPVREALIDALEKMHPDGADRARVDREQGRVETLASYQASFEEREKTA